jgi:hypothetical protein
MQSDDRQEWKKRRPMDTTNYQSHGSGNKLARREFLASAAALGTVIASAGVGKARAAVQEIAPPSGINVPKIKGEYYKAAVPDTLDLAERAHTGLAHFLNLISEENDYEMYWGVNHFYPSHMNSLLGYNLPQPWGGNFAECNPLAMTFNPTVLMACQAKAVEAMAMLRIMSGSRERLDL